MPILGAKKGFREDGSCRPGRTWMWATSLLLRPPSPEGGSAEAPNIGFLLPKVCWGESSASAGLARLAFPISVLYPQPANDRGRGGGQVHE